MVAPPLAQHRTWHLKTLASFVITTTPAIPIILSLLAGIAYAILLPPWDLIDEEQHLHYVQYIVERRELPAMGSTYISPQIIASAFETNRWERLGLSRPPSDDPKDMGLEGLSYEAYQPPLYYLALALPYSLLPDHPLSRLYGLRLIGVLLGTLSVLASYALTKVIWPDGHPAAMGVALVLPLVPERAMAVGRVNNDIMAELAVVTVLLMLALHAKGYFSVKSSVTLGIALGLAGLTKLNALAIFPAALVVLSFASDRRSLKIVAWRLTFVFGFAALITGWFYLRNAQTYGELTGTAAFLQYVSFRSDWSVLELARQLARSFWTTWWGSSFVDAFAAMATAGFAAAIIGLGRWLISSASTSYQRMMVAGLALVVAFSFFGTWRAATTGLLPVIQGRMILPAYPPVLILFFAGLLKLLPSRLQKPGVAISVAIVLLLDSAYLMLYLLPQRYPAP